MRKGCTVFRKNVQKERKRKIDAKGNMIATATRYQNSLIMYFITTIEVIFGIEPKSTLLYLV